MSGWQLVEILFYQPVLPKRTRATGKNAACLGLVNNGKALTFKEAVPLFGNESR